MTLAAGSALLALALGEGLLRVWYALPDYDMEGLHRRSDDPVLLYEMRPSARIERDGIEIATNPQGFRNHDFRLDLSDRDVGTRIVLLGDSVAFGLGVERASIFAELLEPRLDAAFPDGARHAVFNLATVGYNTAQQLRTLETVGLPLDPDLILVTYCLNDPAVFTGGHLRRFHPPPVELLYVASRAWWKLQMRWSGLDYHHFLQRRHREPIASHLERLAALGRKAEAPVVLAVLPVFQWTDDAYPFGDIVDFLEAQASDEGLLFLDLLPAVEGRAPREVARDAWHPNPLGHSLIADALAASLAEIERREAAGIPQAGPRR